MPEAAPAQGTPAGAAIGCGCNLGDPQRGRRRAAGRCCWPRGSCGRGPDGGARAPGGGHEQTDPPQTPGRAAPAGAGAVGRRCPRRLRGRGAALHARGPGRRSRVDRSSSTSCVAPRWGASTPASSPAPPTSPHAQGRLLAERWENFVLEEVVHFGVKEFLKTPATLLGSGTIEELEEGQKRLGGIVNTTMLERIVRRLIPWQQHHPQQPGGPASNRCPSPPPTSARASRWCSSRARARCRRGARIPSCAPRR